jgi:hypothetical protein
MRHRRPIILVPVVAVAAFALLAAGCGGGGGSPGIASIASSTTGTTATTQNGSAFGGDTPSSAPAGGRGGGQFKIGMNVGTVDGAKFSACFRKHGVPNFPDPNGQGVITIQSGMGIDPSSPTYRSAQSTCEKLLPNGGKPTPAQIAQQQQKLLAFSACMRAHGLKDFPDPSNGGLQVRVGPGSDLDPNNPTVQTAQQACQGDLPFKSSSGPAKSGGG